MKKTNKAKTRTKNPRKQANTAQTLGRARPEIAAALAQRWAPGSAQPATAAQFRAEIKAHQVERLLAQVDPQAEELVDAIMGSGVVAPAGAKEKGPRAYGVIKLGVDVHLDRYVVVRQIDGGAPQPAQRFTPAQFLEWTKKQTELAHKVYSCYEAGPFGYSLHRKLIALGVTNYVVRPRDWDEYGKKVKTDQRDARELVLHLDRYVSGNEKAFCVVRVPTEAQEQARSRSRQREALQKEKQRLAAQGRKRGRSRNCECCSCVGRQAAFERLIQLLFEMPHCRIEPPLDSPYYPRSVNNRRRVKKQFPFSCQTLRGRLAISMHAAHDASGVEMKRHCPSSGLRRGCKSALQRAPSQRCIIGGGRKIIPQPLSNHVHSSNFNPCLSCSLPNHPKIGLGLDFLGLSESATSVWQVTG